MAPRVSSGTSSPSPDWSTRCSRRLRATTTGPGPGTCCRSRCGGLRRPSAAGHLRGDLAPGAGRLDPGHGADRSPDDLKSRLRARHLLDERRLAYVAFTRARHTLVASAFMWDDTAAARTSVFIDSVRAHGVPISGTSRCRTRPTRWPRSRTPRLAGRPARPAARLRRPGAASSPPASQRGGGTRSGPANPKRADRGRPRPGAAGATTCGSCWPNARPSDRPGPRGRAARAAVGLAAGGPA